MPPTVPARSASLAAILASVTLTLAGCGSVSPPAVPTRTPAPSPPPRSAIDQRSSIPAALNTERRWLQSWFRDTPVQIRGVDDGAVSIEVPRDFCFAPGSSSVKPALAAVLDKLAESLRRVPLARVPLLAAPDDAGGEMPLALQRATQVQRHLSSRGVAASRIGKPAASANAAVQLRIETPLP